MSREYKRHGMTATRAYKVYTNMMGRCYNHNHPQYRNYGERGIKVCQRWQQSFMAFYEDMGDPPEGLSIERIDNDGIYEPSNCRWADMFEQQANRRSQGVHPGVTLRKADHRWEAAITVHYERIWLGSFDNLGDAIRARKAAEKKYRVTR